MSLYAIEQELLELFAYIEENDGEVTDEIWEKLNISKDNLKLKLNGYVKAVKSWEGDVVNIKAENKNLSINAKIREARVERLKKAMLQAVLLFGDDGKTGNKRVDTGLYNLYTKGSASTEVDDKRIATLLSEFERYIIELVKNDILYSGSDVELQGILDSINANCKSEQDYWNKELNSLDNQQEFIPYTLTDLITIKVKISTTQSIYDLFRTGKDALIMYGKNPITSTMNDSTSKDDWKSAIENANTINKELEGIFSYPTVAKLVKNTSIVIK